ncbi:hypothetical protein RND81_12G058300 [Saponaria officinalis]|uniref:Replication factor A C-terminal domain-containing protein n=1 Tax=Saponaria officinalis TaxID=3572 RepID=A0AAW1H5V8_SAPOF
MYRVVSDSKIMIRFFYNTYIKAVKEEDYVIPKHKFDFSPYPTLEHRRLKFDVLSDVYGVLLNETKEGNATSIEIQDASENRIKLKLWGQCSTIYNQQKANLGDECKLFFIVVTSTLDLYCYCLAEVKEVMSELPWYNPSCPDCNKKPKKGIHDFFCEKCNKSIINPTLVYRLELLVEDSTGTIILTMFNDEVKKMTKQEANTLYDAHAEQDDNDEDYNPVPSLLQNVFEGKIFAFKLKIDSFNHDNRRKQTFTIVKVLDKMSLEVDYL